jgi:ATP-binding cassette, subfamily B, bacterial
VSFSYAGGAAIFDRLNLEINEGEQIGIVGPMGAGKSTLAKLMLRFYEPDSGTIYIDGVDIRDVRISDLRTAVGLVGQENFLFYGTIRENIALLALSGFGALRAVRRRRRRAFFRSVAG